MAAAVRPKGRPVVVTCEICAFRQQIERTFTQPEELFMRCHGCEGLLKVRVPVQPFTAAAR